MTRHFPLPRGRPPIGDNLMDAAERQWRHREIAKEKAATLIALITRGVSEGGDGGERGDNSRHPRSGRHRYSAHRYARGRDPVGWLFLISGIVGLITTFRMRQAPGFWWSLVSAILGIAVGIVLLLWPLSGVLSLTLVLIVFFVIEGVASIMFALEHKRELSGRWGWMLASGIIDLIMAAIIFAGLPGTAVWAIGMLALIAMALHAREIDPRSATPAH